MKATSVLLLGAMLAACGEPLEVGRPNLLGSINGQPLPWTDPIGTIDPPGQITEGWFTILGGGLAERHERFGRTIVDANGDSIPLFAEWTQSGPYRWEGWMIIVEYPFWSPGQMGPLSPAETLYASPRGLTLRQTGFIAPLDSMVRVYCRRSGPC